MTEKNPKTTQEFLVKQLQKLPLLLEDTHSIQMTNSQFLCLLTSPIVAWVFGVPSNHTKSFKQQYCLSSTVIYFDWRWIKCISSPENFT